MAGFCLAISAQAEDLGSVHAHAANNSGVDALGMSLANGTSSAWQLSAEQVARLAGPGGANPEAALGFLPGVSYNAPDALNLANIQSPNKGLRVRGESAQHAAGDLVEGLPLAAGLSGPGQWLVDQEDIRRVNFYAGAVPAAVPAPGSIAGVVDSQTRWSGGESQWQVQQSEGSQYFSCSILRWDSPRLPGASSLFLWGGFTRANLWRG